MSSNLIIKEKLGSGSMGIVYRAFDEVRQAHVALKILRDVEGRSLHRFKSEFRTLTDVLHPNLVKLYELRSVGDDWYLTMEYIEGITFLKYVRPVVSDSVDGKSYQANQVPLDLGRLKQAMHQLIMAVDALHRLGVLHRDIKPSNILIDHSGRLVLCDFGLALSIGSQHKRADSQNLLEGTPIYMSPEQINGNKLQKASDWYSVGVVLFEALVGKPPFEGELDELLSLKTKQDPTPPQQLDPAVPRDLSDLCVSLLARDPRARPDCEQIMQALGFRSGFQESPEKQTVQQLPFIGRETELSTLRQGYARACQGHCVALFISGMSGMGKTALVNHFLKEAQRVGSVLILAGRCYQKESVPFAALDSLIDDLTGYLASLPHDMVEPLMPRHVLALARLFPVLRSVQAVAEPAFRTFTPPDPQENRRLAVGALRELLLKLSQRRPLIIHIDDLQWGDLDSAAFLNDLIHNPQAPAALILASYRLEDKDTSRLLGALSSQDDIGITSANVNHLLIGPLPDQDVESLALSLLESKNGTSAQKAQQIAREANGNPMFAVELARAGEIVTAEQLNLDQLLQRRINQLPSDSRDLMKVIAVAGHPIPIVIAIQAALCAGRGDPIAVLRAERLIRIRLVDDESFVEVYHSRIRTCVKSILSADETRRLHRELARALESSTRSDPQALVEHWFCAGEDQKAGHYAIQAAENSEKALAFHHAAKLYQMAIDLLQIEGEKLNELMAKMALALINSGQLKLGAETLLQAAQLAQPRQALEYRRLAFEGLLRSGHLEEGLAQTEAVLRTVGMKPARSIRAALVSMLLRRFLIRLRGLGFRERQVDQISQQTLRRLDVCWSMANGLTFANPFLGKTYQVCYLYNALKAGEAERIALALCLEIGYQSVAGRKIWEKLVTLSNTTRELCERIGSDHALGFLYACRGFAAYMCGVWQEGKTNFREGLELFREKCSQATWETSLCQFYLVSTLEKLGEVDTLMMKIPVWLNEALQRGDMYAATGHRAWRSNVYWLFLDDPDEARRQALMSPLVDHPNENYSPHLWQELLTHGQIDLYRGDGKAAWGRVEPSMKVLKKAMMMRVQSVRINTYHLHARSAIAYALSLKADDPKRKALLTSGYRSVKALEREKSNWHKNDLYWGEGLALTLRADLALLDRNVELAIAQLQQAVELFDKLDMKLFYNTAKRQLGSIMQNDQGRQYMKTATDWMTSSKIKNPDRLTSMLCVTFGQYQATGIG